VGASRAVRQRRERPAGLGDDDPHLSRPRRLLGDRLLRGRHQQHQLRSQRRHHAAERLRPASRR
jgi:hypothetical protein